MARALNLSPRHPQVGWPRLRSLLVFSVLNALVWASWGSEGVVSWAQSPSRQNRPRDPEAQLLAQAPSAISNWTYAPDQGRLQISTQGPVRPTLFILQNPPRVVVDFPDTLFTADPQDLSYESGRVRSLRISQLTETTTRFVLGLEESEPLTLNQVQLQTATPERWAVQFTGATDLLNPPPPTPSIPQLPAAPNTPQPNLAATPIPPVLSPQTPVLTPDSPSSTPIPTFTPLLRPATPIPLLTPPPRITPSPVPTPITTPAAPVALPLPSPPPAAPILTPPLLPSEMGAPVQVLGIQSLETGFLVQTTGPAGATIRRISDPERVVVDLLNSTLNPGFTQRTLPVNQAGVLQLRAGQFEPTTARVVLDVDPTSGDWETVYDPQQGGVRIIPAGEKAASLQPQVPSNYTGPLATIQAVQLQGAQLTITADGFLFYSSGWDAESGNYRISVSPARLPNTLGDPGLPVDGPVERIRFVQSAAQTVDIFVQPAREFNVIEEAPGQGSRRIALTLQPLDGSIPITPVTPSPGQVPQQGIVVALDAGHGGRDPGAVGVNGVQEKRVNLDIAQKVEQLLLAAGYQVVMTRVDDREIFLQPRVDTAVQNGASIMVSIHTNALDRSGINGIETYYLRPDSTRLAETMHRSIVAGTGAVDRGVRRARFFMVRETPTTMPSVLLELGYLTNPAEGSKLATPEYRTQVAQAVAQGIRAYFEGP